MKIIEGGVTASQGFQASGVYAGIKKNRKDMALVYSSVPAKGAGTFTTNVVKAAPVIWDMKITKESQYVQAVVLNSGVANACTGAEGDKNNELMAEAVAKALNIPINSVYTASTGVIGKQMPIDVIVKGVSLLAGELKPGLGAGAQAAEAIMTTDTYPKECAVSFVIDGKEVKLGGMAKGSGMIHPNMATMLAVITTDLAISKELLQEALSEDVKHSFNMISVDRDTSTNDSLLILANGLAGNKEITEKNDDYDAFCKALNYVTTNLAKKIAADGEGATKLLEVQVIGVKSEEDAISISKSIITSNLVKSAVFGNDANWGRILCAMGYSGARFDPDKVDLYIESADGKLKLVENGLGTDYSEEYASKLLSGKEVKVTVDLKSGNATATAWGCDLTYDYVKINADYRS
ncbi:bifunctional glutamate N-acetyltransferase/amino-acid acetyltransferase ArgJ [Lachnospiraceae bacterium MD1]|uniref:Arginine biosynthesis bifunctional protein ArgJ n=1 Tax=Variimorphobacter saccharofermentans TaxID=2755051 RepID=A0A839K1R1_9FIRM|nr:bifunctional glutamate N-acetyltransferase/amino-acid acetyltransferase ArgJ [Variimorphobacter saccharofermentans]MBB2182641.1 bifunctional glutamate N-acetyltransferase/amino-acid acetyltransferase ArgJ [Variimorphobacter saccharofermentans]